MPRKTREQRLVREIQRRLYEVEHGLVRTFPLSEVWVRMEGWWRSHPEPLAIDGHAYRRRARRRVKR